MISGDRSILQGKRGAFWYTLEELSKHWDRIDVICPTYHIPHTTYLTPFPNVFFYPSPRGLWFQPWWILECGHRLVTEYHHDVMTVHEYPPFYNGIGARWLHRATGIPLVLEIHHIVGWPVASSRSENLGAFLSQIILPREARSAAGVRVVNETVKMQLISWGIPREKISVVPSFYLDSAILKRDVAIQKQYDLVTCARLVANKGIAELLEAVAGLPGVSLLIIGDGPLRRSLAIHARRLGIEHRVTFAGWLATQADVIRAMQKAKIFVMNSRSEGGPRSVLEAMAVGMPVVATRVGVMLELVVEGHNGFFTTGEPSDLASKITHMLDDSAWRRMAAAGPEILGRFERTKLIAQYAGYLQSFTR